MPRLPAPALLLMAVLAPLRTQGGLGPGAGTQSAPPAAEAAAAGGALRALRGSAAPLRRAATTVSQLRWADTNTEAGAIGGGIVSWAPPADTTQVAAYEVYIAYDAGGSHRAQLWYANPAKDQIGRRFPVGTNHFSIYDPTSRKTMDVAHPANWLLVYTTNKAGVQQASADAAKIPLYDLSTSPPGPITLQIDSRSTYLTGSGDVAGTVQWSPHKLGDLGYTESYAVYLSEASGSSAAQVWLQDVPVGTNQLVLQGASRCITGGYLGIYAKNRNGQAFAASWSALQACHTTTTTSANGLVVDMAKTATAGKSRTIGVNWQVEDIDPDSVSFTDTNPKAGQIGGSVIQWSPAIDPAITHYEVYIAYDDRGTHKARLWNLDPVTEEAGPELAVGTNEFNIFEPTWRKTMSSTHPANWLMVFSSSGGSLQPVADSRKLRLYDLSSNVPDLVTMATISFTDTDPADERIAGTLQWEPADQEDLGFTTHYVLYLSKDAAGTDEALLDFVSIGTNKVDIIGGTECWDRNHILVYASNPNGHAAHATSKVLGGCTTPGPTTTLGATTTTLSSTSTYRPTAVSNVVFSDTNSEAGQIGGATVQWSPPTDPSRITAYEVYIAYDALGSYEAQLWYQDPVTGEDGRTFPVGTNFFHVYDHTNRATTNSGYPANWVLVYSLVGGVRQAVSNAAHLYDLSASVPSDVAVSVVFTDMDASSSKIAGTVQWTMMGQADLGLVTHFAVYLAQDASGTGEVSLQNVEVGTNELIISPGIKCWDRDNILVYLRNPNGRSAQAAYLPLDGCTEPAPTTTMTTTTATSTATTTTTITPGPTFTATSTTVTHTTTTTMTTLALGSITDLTFTDVNPEAYELGGAIIEWTPPLDVSEVTGFRVYLSYDTFGSHEVALWFADPDTEQIGNTFPVGTNRFNLFSPTHRATSDAAYPARWVIVYTLYGNQRQDVRKAPKVPVYDNSTNPPGSIALQLDVSGISLSGVGELQGFVRWAATSAKADLSFTQNLAVYVATDDSGTAKALLQRVSLTSDTFWLVSGWTCMNASFVAVILENPNHKVLAGAWMELPPCAPATTSTSTEIPLATTTATATTTTLAPGLPYRITNLVFTDLNAEEGHIGGGVLQWTPPTELTGISAYEAFIAYDNVGSHQAQLWWENDESREIGRSIPVGTNRVTLYHNTLRRTMLSGYPANWLFVYSASGSTRQAGGDAAKIPLYDNSSRPPLPAFFQWITFNDTDAADHRIAGVLQWKPAELMDLGYTTHYAFYLAKGGFDHPSKVRLGTVAVGASSQFLVPFGTECWDRNYILIYGGSPNGQSFVPASHILDGCRTPPPTTTTTTSTSTASTSTMTTTTEHATETATTTTASTSTLTTTLTLDPWLISGLTFRDINPQAGQIGGAIVEWTPPSDTSRVTGYEVWAAHDQLGTSKAQLWYGHYFDAFGRVLPVGTNRFHIFSPTERRTPDPAYPANWVLVYTRSYNELQSTSDAAKVRLYDYSHNVPGPHVSAVKFDDLDPADNTIAGTVEWMVEAHTDLGFTTHYSVDLARDNLGAGRIDLLTVPVGTHSVDIPAGTECWDYRYILVYACNPNGRAAMPAFQALAGCTTPDPRPQASTTARVPTTTTKPPAISALKFKDTNPAANQIGGAWVEWRPPDDTTEVTGYQVYIANDQLGSHKARLWHTDHMTDHSAPRLPVGTNMFSVYEPTARRTTHPQYPANWLFVLLERRGGLQPLEEAARVPLYDVSSDTPSGVSLQVNFEHSAMDDGSPHVDLGSLLGGVLQWESAAQTDLGFTSHYEVYQAANAHGTKKVKITRVPMGTNKLAISEGRQCSSGGYLLVYARNSNGLSVHPSAAVAAFCPTTTMAPPAGTTTAVTTTARPPLFALSALAR